MCVLIDLVKNNPCAYNMYGLLMEQQGLYRSAEEAFIRYHIYIQFTQSSCISNNILLNNFRC